MKHRTTPGLQFLEAELDRLERNDLLRERPPATAGTDLTFCSNDYLDLAQRAAPPRSSGAGASRLVAGERVEHVELERAAAGLVGLPGALVFTSGYAANLGVVCALAGPDDLVVSDALNHASLVDGARLSRAQVVVVPHLEVAAVERALRERGGGAARRAFVVTESYFSMDADSPDLVALRRVCDRHGAALVVDEAHALGVLGPEGRGLCVASDVVPDVLTGTFGKSFGAGGAFVAGCPALITWLWNRARSFVFSTGLSPAVACAARAGIATALEEPERRARALAAAALLRDGLGTFGARVPGYGHVVPWIIGEPVPALHAAAALRAVGVDVRAIRPPSVTPGTARLRFAVTAAHGPAEVARAVEAIRSVAAQVGL